MQLLRCTKKLQKEMGLKQDDLTLLEPPFSFLGSWHANLLYIERKKCVLFVNDKTLFNFLVPDVPRSQIRKLGIVFLKYLGCIISDEGFEPAIKERILEEYSEIGYAPTTSKRILGSMNDLADHYKFHVIAGGGVHGCNLPEIIRSLNRMPMGAIGYKFSLEALKELYGLPEKHTN